jgi:hypothetical protein
MRLKYGRPQWPKKLKKCRTTGKISFRDEIAAKIALGHLMARPLRERKEQRTYFCSFCHHWHLTSQEVRRAQG